MSNLTSLLQSHSFHDILPSALLRGPSYTFDLTENNTELQQLECGDVQALIAYTQACLKKHNAVLGISRYAEQRMIYQTREHFAAAHRCIHLGVDLTVPSGTDVYAPLDSEIHSFADNAGDGNYGPTLILQHKLQDKIFYTLYGHLSRSSLLDKHIGQAINVGATFATIGSEDENGGWPPHLHFQIIEDIAEYEGDYLGVCSIKEASYYLANCPDPQWILRL